MFYFVLSIHLLLCFVLIVLVLLQQGKGASAGAILSGSSNTLFGAAGASTVLTKVTTGCAIAFFCTSIILVKLFAAGDGPRNAVANPLAGSVMGGAVTSNAVASGSATVTEPAPEAPAAAVPVPASPLAGNATK